MSTSTSDQALAASYAQAMAGYDRQWAHVDQVLRQVFDDHPSHRWPDVYVKTVFIDAVYRSSLSRIISQRPADQHVATLLDAHAADLQELVGQITRHSGLNDEALGDVLRAHGAVVELIRSKLGKAPRSFVAKYLHFHAPEIVPVLDSRAVRNIGRYLKWDSAKEDLTAAKRSLARYERGPDPGYYWFAVRFRTLYRHLAQLDLEAPVTVKGVDHMLWLE